MSAINFFRGHPTNHLLPTDAVLKATQSLLTRHRPEDDTEEDRHPMTYGSDPGSLKVRKSLAEWTPHSFKEDLFKETLTKELEKDKSLGAGSEFSFRKELELIKDASTTIDPDSINLTNGASYGAMNALLQLTLPHACTGERTRRAFIVSPTYFLINSVFLDAGFAGKMDAVVQDPRTGSLDWESLEDMLKRYMEYDVDPINYTQVREYEKKKANSLKNSSTSDGDQSGNDKMNDGPGAQPGSSIPTSDSSRPIPRKIFTFVLYLVPTFSNPTGCTMSVQDRIRLLNLARKYDILILCDDVYDLLEYDSDSDSAVSQSPNTNYFASSNCLAPASLKSLIPPRLVTLDRWTLPKPDKSTSSTSSSSSSPVFGNTISNLTFSKLLGPGLRVGWHETVSPDLALNQLAQGGAIRSGGTPSHYTTTLVGELLDLDLVDPVIHNLRKVYAQRAQTLTKAIEKYLPSGTEVFGGQGGYFVWLKLPLQSKESYENNKNLGKKTEDEACFKKLDADVVAQKCKELEKVVLAPGSAFEVEGHPCGWDTNWFRLSVSYLSEEEIEQGIEKFGKVVKGLLDGSIPW